MTLFLYQVFTRLGAPLIYIYLFFRLLKGKEDPARYSERKGISLLQKPAGKLIWVHAASVGESLSMLPLIENLLEHYSGIQIMITTGTVSSANLLADRLPNRAFHQYVPVDLKPYILRFLDHWQPDIALWAESEFWPNLILETQKRGVPMALINGRISNKSFDGWKRAKGLIVKLLVRFEICLGQTDEDANRLKFLGARNHKCVGNLKFAVPPLPVRSEDLIHLHDQIGGRPCWLAASTHSGEEEIIADAHLMLKSKFKSLLTILVPRHPTRGRILASMLKNSKGLKVASRSQRHLITTDTDIYLADTIGELGLFFRLTEVVFMGKSLVPLGGQNPLEALRLSCAVLHGPFMTNFKNITTEMANKGCAKLVRNGTDLANEVSILLDDDKKRTKMIASGTEYLVSQSTVVNQVRLAIMPMINSITDNDHATS